MKDAVSEKAVLACLYRFGYSAYIDVSTFLSKDAFSIEENSIWYNCFCYFYEEYGDKKPDIPSMIIAATECGYEKYLEKQDFKDILKSISGLPVSLDMCAPNAKKIQRLYIARQLSNECLTASNELDMISGSETISNILAIAEDRILNFATKISGEEGPTILGETAFDYIQALKTSGVDMGVPTGFPSYDKSIGGGILPNSVDLISARSKAGKSMYVINIIINIIRQGIPCLHIDTEMTKEEQIRRVVSRISGVPEIAIKKGWFAKDVLKSQKVEKAANEIASLPFYHLCAADKTPAEINNNIRRWFIKDVGLESNGCVKPCVVFYDYLKIMNSSDVNKNMSEHQNIGFILTDLKNMMARYQGRCMAFCQQNRSGLDTDDESSVGLSDRLTWFSTSTTILRWKNADEIAADNLDQYGRPEFSHKLIPIISRHGPRRKPGSFINIKSDLSTCKFEEGPDTDDTQIPF